VESQTSIGTILWRGRYLIVASLVAGVVVAGLVTATSAKVYESTGVIQVESSLATSSTGVLDQQQASQGLATTYATLIESTSFLGRIRPQIARGRYTVAELADRISATPVSHDTQSTNLISLTARGRTPFEARNLAGQVAQAFVKTIEKDAASRTAIQQRQIERRITNLTQQIGKLVASSTPATSPATREQLSSLRAARTALTAELANIVATGVSREGAVSVVGPPTYPRSPVAPRPLLNLLAGIVLGTLVGLGLAWLRNFLDRNVHSAAEVQELIGAPVLASIPLQRYGAGAERAIRESYDLLHTNLTFASPDAIPQVLTITSQQAGEGKTATVEGLASAAARRRVRVAVVDADLRRRSLSTQHDLQFVRGLTNLIAGGGRGEKRDLQSRNVNDLLRRLPNGVSVLAAGPSPPNPPTVIGSARMRAVIDDLRSSFDLILIDSPPLPHLADATLLAALADGAVLVVRPGTTRKKALGEARDALARTGTPLLGVAVFERRSASELYYYSGEAPKRGLSGLRARANPSGTTGLASFVEVSVERTRRLWLELGEWWRRGRSRREASTIASASRRAADPAERSEQVRSGAGADEQAAVQPVSRPRRPQASRKSSAR
jgi:capsular exopolysaccharide synthesis family protein